MIRVTVTGQPVAKGRTRVVTRGGQRPYTPAKTRAWEKLAENAARIEMGHREPLNGPLSVTVTAIFPVPATWPRWKRLEAEVGHIGHVGKPDGDNVAKAAKDALNGVVWLDDAQVVRLLVHKTYGARPAVVIEVATLPLIPSNCTNRDQAALMSSPVEVVEGIGG